MWSAVLPVSHVPTAHICGSDHLIFGRIRDLLPDLAPWPVAPARPESGTTLRLSFLATAPTGEFRRHLVIGRDIRAKVGFRYGTAARIKDVISKHSAVGASYDIDAMGWASLQSRAFG